MEGEPRSSTTPESLLADDGRARDLYDAVFAAVKGFGQVGVRAGKSQIAFRHQRPFAAVWRPSQYLRGETAPLVLTIYLPFREPSPRWKQIVEPVEGHFTHHLELWHEADVDDDVVRWLRRAWNAAA